MNKQVWTKPTVTRLPVKAVTRGGPGSPGGDFYGDPPTS